VEGIAAVERVRMQREDDVTPTRVRIVLSTDAAAAGGPTTEAVGYDGFVQGGFCDAPTNRVRVSLKSRGEHDVRPFVAKSSKGDPVTTAYYGAPAAPGFGFASTYTKQRFSLVISDTETASPLACGNILQPDDDDFTEAGVLLVQLQPTGGSGVAGYALVERTATQREIDVTPTRIRIALFAPPITIG
jgi:hypothetical protein